MKFHIGATKQGVVHSLAAGPANEADITRIDELLHGQETELEVVPFIETVFSGR